MTDFSDLDSPNTQPAAELELADPPAWPKIVGIISIVLGGIGLTCIGCSGVGVVMLGAASGTMEQANDGYPLPPSMDVGVMMYAQLVLGLLTAVLLLFAGIVLLGRSPLGRLLHLAYGIINVPAALWGVYIQYDMMSKMDAYVAQYPDAPMAQGYTPIGQIIGIVFGLVLGLAYPVFCVVWFGFIKTKPTDMTGGAKGVY